MISMLFQSNISIEEKLMLGAMIVVVLIYSLSIHELMHGYSAYLLGDDTAKLKGRLTMNPLAHLDPIGSLMFLFIGFGWAKPIPVDYGKLTRLKSRDAMVRIVSVAGVTANFLSAWVAYFLLSMVNLIASNTSWVRGGSEGAVFVYSIIIQFIWLFFHFNLLLMAFNLLPFPPLDGYHILETIIPYRYRIRFYKYEPYFRYGLMALVLLGMFTGFSPLFWLVEKIQLPFRYIIQTPLDWLSPLNKLITLS
ncbi:MAG: site-2 protease family protein [Clostridiales bacterium]|nr:site-2 protease family protein [Clostridiales bacterium]